MADKYMALVDFSGDKFLLPLNDDIDRKLKIFLNYYKFDGNGVFFFPDLMIIVDVYYIQ